MRRLPYRVPVSGKPIYTLAQTGTENFQNSSTQPVAMLAGKGSDLSNTRSMQMRAKKKVINQAMAKAGMILAEREGDKELKKSFRNTYYCQSQVITHSGKLHAKYCKNRLCSICNGIRKADIINRYLPVVKDWTQPYFVTLTVKSCAGKDLRSLIKMVLAVFREITAKHRKRNQRSEEGIKLMGIKSLEVEFNPIYRTYHPHLHIIVPDKKIADILLSEWLTTWNKKYKRYTSPKAQNSKPVYSLGGALVEIIKYGTKIFTAKDVYDKANRKGDKIYAAAKYNIIKAMSGLRIFERFGFNLPEMVKEDAPAKVVTGHMVWRYLPPYHDWVCAEHEATLTGYILPPELHNILTYNVDMVLE